MKDKLPVLTLDPNSEEIQETVNQPDEIVLTSEEEKLVQEFSEKIDISDANMVLQYGASAQSKISSFSESTLEKVRTKDLGEIGDSLSELVAQLKTNEKPAKKGFFGLFNKSRIEQLKANYASTQTNIDKVVSVLEKHQISLMKDITMLDHLYEMNLENYKELTLYILAGKRKLETARQQELPKLVEKANQSRLPQDAQAANDYAEFCNRFEKKLHDLELTRTISIQMAPQIRLVQNNDTLMAEKIQSSLINTIPLWKSQMVLALGIENSRQAMEAQRTVTDMTNELLKRNSAMLKQGTIETAKESERGIVDIETLQSTNKDLIETLDEVLRIQTEGQQKRQQAEAELRRIENELKEKLTNTVKA
ncbi:toxic anion resistance protein [uncultured Traorella sp.]|uniref:toxic anion resistance protein n=1 Tax=uncultured Traorella sp. TaxID=1929048 RepID=UPI0025E7B2A7|nr:toxic anion resistance protein [uncultured Traorella sp.]